MKTVLDIPELKNKKVLLRVDFDVPVRSLGEGGRVTEIAEPFRIKKQKEMLDWLVERGAKVVMAGHLHTDKDSFLGMVPQLNTFLGREIGFIKNTEDILGYLEKYPGPGLLENMKCFEGEESGSEEFVKKLSENFDLYINNCFSTSHRRYASIVGVPGVILGYAGLQVIEEIRHLGEALSVSSEGKVVIIGGAKGESKIPVIKNLIGKAEYVLLGGVVANDVLKARGQDMGSSVVDENYQELLAGLDINDPKLLVPEDFVISDNKILDIGEKTIHRYSDAISRSSMIIWNGPMGLFENPSFATGTNELAQAVIASGAYKIVGGGDTISAVDKLGILDKFDFVSTGGGAMLAFLAGQRLSGLEALGYYK